MKIYRLNLILLILLILSSCGGAPEPTPIPMESAFKIYRDEYFQVVVPDWESSPAEDAETIFGVHKDGQFVLINRYPNLPEIFATSFRSYIEEDPDAYLVQEGEQGKKPFFEFTTRDNNQTMRFQTVLQYCQGYTYAVITGGRDTVENADLFQQVLVSSSCQDPYQIPDLETGKIGMMINPAEDDPLENYYPALRIAKENGVQVAHSYLQWRDVESTPGERNWQWNDYLLGYKVHEGFEISLVVNLIHTGVRGPIPEDLKNKPFDDPEFIQRFTDFILDVLDRYPVSYLSIGNEVNDYFITHREEIPSYKVFFQEVYEAIKERHPELLVGMTFAYHDAESTNGVDIIQQLNLGDFLPVTLYIYNQGFIYTRDPAELEGYLERILSVAEDTPIAFAEIGWSTADSLQGNQGDQALFVQESFRLLAAHQEQIEFLSWFALHDSQLENSSQAALTFIPDRPDLSGDEEFMRTFVDFLTYMGLRESDGTPKEAWEVFREEAQLYLEKVP